MTIHSDPEIDAIATAVSSQRKIGRPPGIPSSANRDITYRCDHCGKVVDRVDLFAEQVRFLNLASKKQARARIVAWICRTCMIKHPNYTRVKRVESPGARNTNA